MNHNETETLYEKQLKREEDCANSGYKKFQSTEDTNYKTNNGSNGYFGRQVKETLLADVIKEAKKITSRSVGYNASECSRILQTCVQAKPDGSFTNWFSIEESAFIALQSTLDTALNPNIVSHTIPSKGGGEKRLLAKKTLNELEQEVGRVIQTQMKLRIVQATFPAWFRKASSYAEKPDKDGVKSSTSYYEFNIQRLMELFASELREEGKHEHADFLERKNLWTYRERRVIGSLMVSSVLRVCGSYLEVTDGFRNGKKAKEVTLTQLGKETEKQIREFVSQFAIDLLPMLVTPLPITNSGLGGWISDALHQPEKNRKIRIELSERHLEFINNQARVKFQVNPFIHNLMNELVRRNLSLGKFHYTSFDDIPSVPQVMGITSTDPEFINEQMKERKKEAKEARRQVSRMKNKRQKELIETIYSYQLLAKLDKVGEDDYFYIPMKFDGRGRIYSRVPFLSFQSADAGRYLLRFAEKTPIDDRTKFWMSVGLANAAGQDKKSWDERVSWVDRNLSQVENVGRMMTSGDFGSAFEFLDSELIDDPFAFAAIAEEFVKVFIDKTQDYTQVYVCVDASCSGTSIFNSWRLNYHGALKTNLINTPEPADIYTEVWNEIKNLAEDGTFRPSHIRKLEKTKHLRKMMKGTYIPASYSSPTTEQHRTLREFNRTTLKKNRLDFTDKEMDVLVRLWDTALDKVSSINSVVSWFKTQTSRVLATGKKEIVYETCNGSRMELHYPKTKRRKVKTIHYGSTNYRSSDEEVPTDEVDKRKLLASVTANITHATDAAALCEAMWNWNRPMVTIHDACGVPPGRCLDDAVMRLKSGFLTATSHPVFETFCDLNGVSMDAQNSPPMIGDLNRDDILHSSYLFS